MSRRTFIKRAFWTLTGASLLAALYAWLIEPFWLEFVRVKMPVRNLPAELVGKTVMQISDIHVSDRFDYQFIIKSFQKAAALKPDFVVYTGDYVSTSRGGEADYEKLHNTLQHLVKGKMGTLAILGNHDYGRNWAEAEVAEKIATMLQAQGAQVLRNESAEVAGINFIGIDDRWGLNFAPEKAMRDFDKTKANIVLCHNPDVCDMDIWGDYDGWILSGHTHGGQVKPPFLPPPLLPVQNKRYSAGKFDLSGGRTLYINRALGHLYQIRFNMRPEITIFELEQA